MATLQIVRTVKNMRDKNSTLYMNSILKIADEMDVQVDIRVANNSEEFAKIVSQPVPTLVLQPCEYHIEPAYNAEMNQTARVCARYIKENVSTSQNVLIVSRSRLIGRPLANILLDYNYTVTIAHSQTENLRDLSLDYDAIVIAAGNPSVVDNIAMGEAFIVDVADDLAGSYHEKYCKQRIGMREIGAATTRMLLDDCIELENQIRTNETIDNMVKQYI